MAKEIILVVDDNDDIRMACVMSLKAAGYLVTSAVNGESAIDLLKKFKYDMVLTDYQMGEVNGIDVLKIAKSINPDCEVIMMTAYASHSLAVEVLRTHGGSNFICKPIDVAKLRATVSNCFEKKAMKKYLQETKKGTTTLPGNKPADPK